MKLKALSHYNGDRDTKFGDCIMIYDYRSLIVYDCGHVKHAEAVEAFLQSNWSITQVYIVVSHNDYDHTSGVCGLLEWLNSCSRYSVQVYLHLYLKHVDTIVKKVDDERRNRESIKEAVLDEFNNIKKIIETAQTCNFSVNDALIGVKVGDCIIVGPTEDEFTDAVAKAVDNRESDKIGEGLAEETVKNAASIQLSCKLDNAANILLCGDASPDYLHNLNVYDVVQLPHHGQLDSAKAIFDELQGNSYKKDYLVSDNTGSAISSGGSDKLVKYMDEENYDPAMNTKNGPVFIPSGGITTPKQQGVKLGDLDYKCWQRYYRR